MKKRDQVDLFDNAQLALWGAGPLRTVCGGEVVTISVAECNAIAATLKEASEVVSGFSDPSVDGFINAITAALHKARGGRNGN